MMQDFHCAHCHALVPEYCWGGCCNTCQRALCEQCAPLPCPLGPPPPVKPKTLPGNEGPGPTPPASPPPVHELGKPSWPVIAGIALALLTLLLLLWGAGGRS